MNTLTKWVEKNGGACKVCHPLGVSHSSLYFWMKGQVSPNLQQAVKIFRLSKGEVTFEALAAIKPKALKQ